jgi:hypothetical protein
MVQQLKTRFFEAPFDLVVAQTSAAAAVGGSAVLNCLTLLAPHSCAHSSSPCTVDTSRIRILPLRARFRVCRPLHLMHNLQQNVKTSNGFGSVLFTCHVAFAQAWSLRCAHISVERPKTTMVGTTKDGGRGVPANTSCSQEMRRRWSAGLRLCPAPYVRILVSHDRWTAALHS